MDLNTTVEVVSSSPTSPTSTSTSLLHTLPSLITTSLLSHLSPHLVPPTANPLAVTASISPTQSAHFFVHDVKVRGTTKRNVEFHILLTVNHAVREEPTECDTSDATVNSDTTSPPKHRGTLKHQAKTVNFQTRPPTTIALTTLPTTPESFLTGLGATLPHEYVAAVTAGSRATPANVNGTITVEPQPFDQTLATFTATVKQENGVDRRSTARGGTVAISQALTSATSSHNLKTSKSPPAPPRLSAPNSAVLAHLLALLPRLHATFSRSAAVDEAMYTHFEAVTMPNATPPLPHESSLVATSLAFDVEGFRRIRNTLSSSVAYYQKSVQGDSAWGKATAIIDTSADRVTAWLWTFMSNERRGAAFQKNPMGLRKVVHSAASDHSLVYIATQKLGSGLDDRVFSVWYTWVRMPDWSLVVAFTDVAALVGIDPVATAANKILHADARAVASVHATVRGFWHLKPLAANVCEATYVTQGRAGGLLPFFVINAKGRKVLNATSNIQMKYIRNGRVVDGELRATFPPPPPLDDLTAEQTTVMSTCQSLEQGSGVTKWIVVKSPSPFVASNINYSHRIDDRTDGASHLVTLGTTTVILDCPALHALAYLQTSCSRERIRVATEMGDFPPLQVCRNTAHDHVDGNVKHSPFPLLIAHREFVNRRVCATDANGDYIYAAAEAPDVVDYGMKIKVVRARVRSFARFSPVSPTQCSFTFYQYVDVAGWIPPSLMRSRALAHLGISHVMRAVFQRDSEIDSASRQALAEMLRTEAAPAEHEVAVVARVTAICRCVPTTQYKAVESPDAFVKMGYVTDLHTTVAGLGRATTVVDASVAECAVWEMDKMGREQVSSGGSLERRFDKRSDHHGIYYTVKEFKVPSYAPRAFLLSQVWKWGTNGTLVVVNENTDDEEFPIHSDYVRTKMSVLWTYEKLEPVNGMPQTRVTYTISVDLGGAIPNFLVPTLSMKQLMNVSKLRARFDRSGEANEARRRNFSSEFLAHAKVAEYDENEEAQIAAGLAYFDKFQSSRSKSIKMPSTRTEAKIAFVKNGTTGWGWSTALVRALPEDCLWMFWDVFRRNFDDTGTMERVIDEQPSEHSLLYYVKKKCPTPFAHREFLARNLWKCLGDGCFIFVSTDELSEKRKIDARTSRRTDKDGGAVVRASFASAMKFTKTRGEKTRIEYVVHPDFKGKLPSFLVNRAMTSILSYVSEIEQHFQEKRKLDELDDYDGRALGARLMHPDEKKHNRRPWEKVREIVRRHEGLREVEKEYSWLVPFLEHAVRGKLALAATVETKLDCLSEMEARRIGRNLSPALRARKTAEAGLYQWQHQNTSMMELFEKYPWMEAMMLVIAKDVVTMAPWGLLWRVCSGAALSTVDMVSDIYVISKYLGDVETSKYGHSMIMMISLSLFFQSILVWIQHKNSPGVLTREFLLTVVGLKPASDAYAVCTGRHMEKHHSIDAKTELIITKSAETVCESIPSTLLQIYFVVKERQFGRNPAGAVVVSILLSMLTTGFNVATISYDLDTDPAKRKQSPDFYGYIPDSSGKRMLLLICMTANSSLLLLMRSTSAALLLFVNKKLFFVISGVDLGIFLLYKVAREDFHYWLPVGGLMGWFFSFNSRIIVKTICDYTGLIHMRNPQELGGLYWTFNTMMAVIVCYVSVWVYLDGGGKGVEERTAWLMVTLTSFSWAVTFGVFLLLMKKEFRKAFFSLEKGKDATMARFESDDEAIKASIIRKNKKQWRAIREDVREWVQSNWWRWSEERPAWMTESWMSKIPAEWIEGIDK